MLTLDPPLVCAQEPPLQERGDPMHPRQQGVGRLSAALNHPWTMNVSGSGKARIRRQAVGDDHASRFHGLLDESDETVRGGIPDSLKPDTADGGIPDLGSHSYKGLVTHVASPPTFLDAPHEGFVHLYLAPQTITPRTDHRPAKLVEPCPRCRVTAQSQNPLQPKGTGPILLTAHPPHHLEPEPEGLSGPVEDCARRHGRLVFALLAMHQPSLGQPGVPRLASRAPIPRWPAEADQVFAAQLLAGEPSVKLFHGARILAVQHGPILRIGVTGR